MATIKRNIHLGVKTTEELHLFIVQVCNEEQMTMTEYINKLIREDKKKREK